MEENKQMSEELLHHYALRRRFMLVGISILAFILVKFSLPFEDKVNSGFALLVFIAIMWLTEAVHVSITALLIPFLAVVLGLVQVKGALANFANPTIFLFFGGFALSAALHKQGLDRYIANRLIELAKGRVSVAIMLLFLATGILSMWISNTATAAIMLPLSLGVLANLNEETDRNTFVFVLLGIAFSASIGGFGTIVGSPPNAIASQYLGLDFFGWMKLGIPFFIFMFPAMIAILWFVFKPKLNFQFAVQKEDFKWTFHRKLSIVIFALAALSWIFSKPLSELLGGIKDMDSLIALGAAVAVGVSACAKWPDIQKNTDWGVLFLFGGGLTLSSVLGSCGASKVLAENVALVLGGAPMFFVVAGVSIFIIALTNFTSNTASAALLVPLFGGLGVEMGMPSALMPLIVGFGASCAFLLPVGTPPNAIVFGTGKIKQMEMVKGGFWLSVISVILLVAFSLILWVHI